MNAEYFLAAMVSYVVLLLVNAYGFWRIAKVKGWNYSLNLESNEFLRDKICRYGLTKVMLISFSVFVGLTFLLSLINDFLVAVATGVVLSVSVQDLQIIRYELRCLKDYSKDYVR